VTVSLSEEPESGTPLSVQVSVASLFSAEIGVEVEDFSERLTFESGQSLTQTVTIAVFDDLIPEVDETFAVRLSDPTPGSTINAGVQIVTLTSDD
jgi:hypothetical protein